MNRTKITRAASNLAKDAGISFGNSYLIFEYLLKTPSKPPKKGG